MNKTETLDNVVALATTVVDINKRMKMTPGARDAEALTLAIDALELALSPIKKGVDLDAVGDPGDRTGNAAAVTTSDIT